ncbi:MAG: hypothetical protein US31_C0011G0010 [Berkelbacteria bacterium GW2011_GWA1_36_9]|uniref:PsbP C-terminal domain-containing protein n=1 Tax=Berkelbacteria bacterium GW2011_GWA1_36_9 TaxID=1618331 RepID=A0A0G0FFY8_9BACT|nr:MAG: hypothetical protein US31_C0011G0010 [Berkelbacteria bacterium GW2011_GWA1_36_9]
MTKNNSRKIVLIIIFVVLGVFIIGGIIAIYKFYKLKTQIKTPIPAESLLIGDSYVTESWLPYQNSRYGFSLKYPQTFSKQESQNGDGITLTLNSPAITIRAYASNNALAQNLDEYLNFSRDNLFQETEGAEEVAANDMILGGVSAQERRWQYINSVDGSKTIMDQVTTLKGDIFYTVQMVIGASAYSEYVPMFDEILKSYKF